MTVEEIRSLPLDEKLRLMEVLWEDLRGRFDSMAIPQAQKDLLDERRRRVGEGAARLFDWDAVKTTIGRS